MNWLAVFNNTVVKDKKTITKYISFKRNPPWRTRVYSPVHIV
jgi:hypothetical protein